MKNAGFFMRMSYIEGNLPPLVEQWHHEPRVARGSVGIGANDDRWVVSRFLKRSRVVEDAGAWRWLSGGETYLPRVPAEVGATTRAEAERVANLDALTAERPLLHRQGNRPVIWVRTDLELKGMVAELVLEPVVGLDVETTLSSRTLCLIQLPSREATYLIDALEVTDLAPLGELLLSSATKKLIHYVREILGRHGLKIDAVVDIRDVSRQLRSGSGRHSLRDVCTREFGMELDKREQSGDWTRRPLRESSQLCRPGR